MASRPGALRSCRCRSVRVTPFCCACAPNGARTAAGDERRHGRDLQVLHQRGHVELLHCRIGHRRPAPPMMAIASPAHAACCWPCLFIDDVVGVPVRPVLIVLAAVALLVFAMGGGRAAQRCGEIGRRGERGVVAVDAAGQSRGDFLQQPAIAVGIAERGIRTVAAALRIRAAAPDPPEQIGLVRADMHVAAGVKRFADRNAAAEQARCGRPRCRRRPDRGPARSRARPR